MLGTRTGEQLTWFLAKDKKGFNHKILKSVTLFAADSARYHVVDKKNTAKGCVYK